MKRSRKISPLAAAAVLASLLIGCASLPEKTARQSEGLRAPARDAQHAEVDLRSLYPELSEDAFLRKVRKASSPLKFFRAFPPLYYRLFDLKKDSLPSQIKKATAYPGWCAGDAHPENFGVLVGEGHHAQFALIDLDDSGPCTIVADLLRFLVAAKQSLPESPDGRDTLGRLLDAYFDGVEGRVKLSAPVKKILSDAEQKLEFNEELRVYEDQLELTASVSLKEKQSLIKLLSSIYGPVSQFEATRYAKNSGGSAGVLRYRVRFKTKSEIIVLELKTVGRPAVFFEREGGSAPSSDPTMVDPIQRVRQALAFTAPEGRSKHFQVKQLEKIPMLISPRYRGIRSIELERDSDGFGRDALRILRDEAAVLGSLHSRSRHRTSEYLRDLRQVTPEQWESAEAALWNSVVEIWEKVGSKE